MAEDLPGPHQLRRVNHEFVQYIRRDCPKRAWRGEGRWPLVATAALLRMCDTVDSTMAVMAKRKLGDARSLLRSLYEQVVVFSWVSIDPPVHLKAWDGDAKRQQLKLHRAALAFGQIILTPRQVADYSTAPELPPTEVMALAADKHWPSRVEGLHSAGLLSFHGLYQHVYRLGSRSTHSSIAALDPM